MLKDLMGSNAVLMGFAPAIPELLEKSVIDARMGSKLFLIVMNVTLIHMGIFQIANVICI